MTRPPGVRPAALAALFLLGAVLAPSVAPSIAIAAEQDGPRLSLAEVLASARAASPQIAAARSREAAAVAAAATAGRWRNPEISLQSENWGAPESGLPLDSFATVRQTLELGGKRSARRGAAEAAAVAARAGALGTLRDIERGVVRRFLDTVRLRNRAAVRREQVASLDELLRVLGRRVEEGVAPEADRARLEVEREAVAVAAVRAEAAAEQTFLELAALADLPSGTTAESLEPPGAVALPVGDAERLAADATRARPDVGAAAARAESAAGALDLARSARVPDLSVATGLKRTLETNTGVLGVAVSVPLFDRRQAAIARASGDLRAAELEREGVIRLARADAAAALGTARRLAEAAARAGEGLVAPATLARAATRSAFDLGAADLLRLVDAERAFAEARLLADGLRLEATEAAIAARLALGEDPLP